MPFRKHIISNTLVWEVVYVEEKSFQTVKKGTIERHLKSNLDPEGWLVDHKEFYVTVKHKKENFNRIFVIPELEAKSILFS